ncbi:MAG TPA: DUF917 domain-containing protein [Candidatus Thioglobus sp.]|jgi:DUF917 family protein|nr:DUF917 domain-containing protein [Candidatus Thioglobus sp.]HIL42248.1 DUF917 domain-containing protein [Gammaproteobacteria bacterium]
MSVKKLTFVDKKSLNAIALGGAVLGSGGGGDPYVGRLMTQQSIEKSGGVKVIDIESLPDDALILPIAMMGAPTVMVEKFPSGNEFAQLIPMIEKMLTKPVSAILCAEAGGLNSTIPFVAASKLGLPIIDGDAMGRAFPELQMVTFTLGGISATPMAMVDEKGNGCTFDTISNVWTEKLARAITIQMGGSAMCSLYPVTAKECKDYLIRGSLSLIHHIGNIIEKHSFNAYEILVKELNGKHLFQGRVRDVERRTEGGWNRGIVKLEGIDEFVNRDAKIDFQNEFLVAMEGDTVLATTPDLICVFDSNTGAPVTAETIKYGLAVNVLGLPCNPIWQSKEALDMIGPRYFKYDIDYKPL